MVFPYPPLPDAGSYMLKLSPGGQGAAFRWRPQITFPVIPSCDAAVPSLEGLKDVSGVPNPSEPAVPGWLKVVGVCSSTVARVPLVSPNVPLVPPYASPLECPGEVSGVSPGVMTTIALPWILAVRCP